MDRLLKTYPEFLDWYKTTIREQITAFQRIVEDQAACGQSLVECFDTPLFLRGHFGSQSVGDWARRRLQTHQEHEKVGDGP